ncbi:phosphatase 2C-like domain-containing protein, partial [Dimargaris cristalligena]
SINSDPTQPDIIELLKQAFIDMDREIVHDALHLFVDEPETVRPILFPAITGSCAVVALIDETTKELYVAHCGDSRAILGAHDSPWAWKGIQLTSDHNAAIELERVRLSRDHQDGMSVVVGDRVLGLLAVTRAFGDASFKWHRHLVQAIYPGLFPDKKCPDPMASISPPYITARPDVMRLKLRPQDRFLVLASDGLFEGLSNELVAELMGGFFEQIVSNGGDPDDKFNFIMDDPTFTPTEERRLYLDAGLEHGLRKGAPIYQEGQENEQRINAATLLIENTFNIISKGATPSLLALKAPDSSNYRDDVTVAVIFF